LCLPGEHHEGEAQSENEKINVHIEAILIITGAATAMAVIQFIAPVPVLRMIFGEAPTNSVSLALARHWGLLIFCVGALLIYAASHPAVRDPAMVFAATEKIALGAGVLGTSLRKHAVAVVIGVGDSLIALIYIGALVGF
jgi:hypothetical protein